MRDGTGSDPSLVYRDVKTSRELGRAIDSR
jgi:hypothetical protein